MNAPLHPTVPARPDRALDAEGCYRALRARDARFDGVFYVGVSTTGIYCRPICTARTPGQARCRFFRSAAEAERDGFRACFRCRPEIAPGGSSVDSTSRLVAAAVERIEAGAIDDASLDDLAAELGVTARHLRRAMHDELGVSPIELAQSRRLALAKQLLHDTTSSIAEVALASGFASLRRFNAAFRARYDRAPSAVRRASSPSRGTGGSIALTLGYRPPLDWGALLAFIGARATPGVERVEGDTYLRTVQVGERAGWIAVTPREDRAALRVEVTLPLAGGLMPLVARLRRLFDLDAHPATIGEHLASHPTLGPLVARRPGLRVPGAFDPFEIAVRAVLGQQVSVAAATTLAGRFAGAFGEPVTTPHASLTTLFPRPERVARATVDALAAIGLPRTRAQTLSNVAVAVAGGALRFDARADPDAVIADLERIPGVGPWTAHYIAMRALGAPDAFPDGDLVLRRILGVVTARDARALAEPWRPWRSYAAMHLWTSLAGDPQ